MSTSRVEKTEGLIKHVHITIAAQEVDQACERKIKETAPKIRLDGFRVGKVPATLVRQKFGAQLRQEALNEMLDEHLGKAIDSLTLKVCGIQGVDFIQNETGKDVVFNAKIEVLPSIQVNQADQVAVERILASVTESDVDEMLGTMRFQKATWSPVDRAAQKDDRLNINFVGKMEGEAFKGGSSDHFDVVLGSGHMIAGFEEGLMGKKAGDEATLDLSFPEDYGRTDLAGKPVSFEVKVNAVSEPELPELNDEFAKQFQVDTYEKLRQEIRENMERELEFGLNSTLKTKVLEALLALTPVEVPTAILGREVQALKQQAAHQFRLPGGGDAWKNLPDMLFMEQAQKRVKMSLLVEALIAQFEIVLDQDRVNAMIQKVAAAYENAGEAVHELQQDQSRYANIQQSVLEDQLVAHLLTLAKVTDKTMTFKDAMKTVRNEHE